MEDKVPNLVIAGVNKAGTTSLFRALARHPQVVASDVKETCFFLPLRYDEPQPPVEHYGRHFPDRSGAKIVMEATPGYFYGGGRIAPVLAGLSDELRVVVSLREPVSRLLSFFRFQKSMLTLPADLTADDYVTRCLEFDDDDLVHRRELNPWFGVRGGFYDRDLPDWIEHLGDRLHVVFFDDLVADADRTVRDLGAVFGLDPTEWPDDETGRENRTIAPRRRALHRVALAVNGALEGPLRRHPTVKSRVRSLYHRVNADAAIDDLSPGCRASLEARYAESMSRTAALLAERAPRLPPWLR